MQTARRYLRLIEAAGAGDGQGERRRLRGDTAQVIVGEGGGGLVGEAGCLAEHLPQPGVAGAYQQGGGFVGCHGLPPPVQPVQHLLKLPVGEEVQHAAQSLAAGGHGAGEVEDGGTADAVLGEQHLAAVFRHGLSAPADGDAALRLDALQRTGVGGVGFQLDEGGVQRCTVVPQALCQLVAVHDAAHLAAGAAAGGENELSGGEGVRLRPHGEAVGGFLHGGDCLPGDDLDVGLLQRVAQHVQHAARHVAHGIDAAAVLGDGQQTEGGKVLQGAPYVEGVQRVGAEAVAAVIAGGGDVVVRQVAPPVAGDQQLAPHAALPLQQRDAAAMLCGGQCRHHAAGSAADDDNVPAHFCASSLRRVR